MSQRALFVEQIESGWVLAGDDMDRFGLVNDFLSYLVDRNYSPQTVRSYAFSLVAFCRWLAVEQIELSTVTTDVLLRFLAACRTERVAGRPGPNVMLMDGRRADSLSPASVNLRLAAVSGLFAFRAMRDPGMSNPVPKGREARRLSAGERGGMLAHVSRAPKRRSALRVREAQRLPKSLDRYQVVALLESLHTWRDRAIAGLMVFFAVCVRQKSSPST